MQSGRCKTCRQPLLWITFSGSGKRMPLDPEPTADGNVYQNPDGHWSVVTKADQPRRHLLGALYKPHFQSCPQAAQHRQRTKKARQITKAVEIIAIEDGSSRTVRAPVAIRGRRS